MDSSSRAVAAGMQQQGRGQQLGRLIVAAAVAAGWQQQWGMEAAIGLRGSSSRSVEQLHQGSTRASTGQESKMHGQHSS